MMNIVKDISLQLDTLETKLKNKESIDDTVLNLLEMTIKSNNFNNLNEYKIIKKRFYKLKKKIYKLTEWEMLKHLIKDDEQLEKTNELIAFIDENKSNLLNEEDIKKIEDMYRFVLDELYSNNYDKNKICDREIIINEINKKIKLFKNRLSRVSNFNFGNLLKEIRNEKGLTLKDVELVSGVSSSYIYRLENVPTQIPSVAIIEKLSKALNLNTEDILSKLNIETQKEDDLFLFLNSNNNLKFNGKILNKKEINSIIEYVKNLVISQ